MPGIPSCHRLSFHTPFLPYTGLQRQLHPILCPLSPGDPALTSPAHLLPVSCFGFWSSSLSCQVLYSVPLGSPLLHFTHAAPPLGMACLPFLWLARSTALSWPLPLPLPAWICTSLLCSVVLDTCCCPFLLLAGSVWVLPSTALSTVMEKAVMPMRSLQNFIENNYENTVHNLFSFKSVLS